MIIDSAVTCIILRELIEAEMFCLSYFGSVLKNKDLSRSAKVYYLRAMLPAVIVALCLGLTISVILGFVLAGAVNVIDEAANGIEAGEAVSKMIASVFICDLSIKVPKWFGISNYPNAKVRALEEAVQDKSDEDTPKVVALEENESAASKQARATLGSRRSMAFMLFWNVARESTEGGSLTAIACILSSASLRALGASIGVALGAAIGLSIFFSVGAKKISPYIFGIAATVLATLLGNGLVTGSVRSFEEVYAYENNDTRSAVIYDYGETPTGDTLTSFEFMGISDSLTALTLCTWILTPLILLAIQINHNYFGNYLWPWVVRRYICCKKSARMEADESSTSSTTNNLKNPAVADVEAPLESKTEKLEVVIV